MSDKKQTGWHDGGKDNRCFAQKGQCPFGGESGVEGHFPPTEEGKRQLLEYIEKKHSGKEFSTIEAAEKTFDSSTNVDKKVDVKAGAQSDPVITKRMNKILQQITSNWASGTKFTNNQNKLKNSENDLEDIIAETLIADGLEEKEEGSAEHKLLRRLRKQLDDESNCDDIMVADKGYWFVAQPFGTQSAPDFIINFGGRLIKVEAKRNKGEGLPMMNGHAVNLNEYYVFASSTSNIISSFRGDELFPEGFVEDLKKDWAEQELATKKKNEERAKKYPDMPLRQVARIRKAYDWSSDTIKTLGQLNDWLKKRRSS